jgi:hypothetical protein
MVRNFIVSAVAVLGLMTPVSMTPSAQASPDPHVYHHRPPYRVYHRYHHHGRWHFAGEYYRHDRAEHAVHHWRERGHEACIR